MRRTKKNLQNSPDPYEDMVKLEKLDPYESLIKSNFLLKENHQSSK